MLLSDFVIIENYIYNLKRVGCLKKFALYFYNYGQV
jgi:hypothetical protein